MHILGGKFSLLRFDVMNHFYMYKDTCTNIFKTFLLSINNDVLLRQANDSRSDSCLSMMKSKLQNLQTFFFLSDIRNGLCALIQIVQCTWYSDILTNNVDILQK
jgi:hypothetical protein